MDVKVTGIAESFKKHATDKTDTKGIKAYFRLDEGGFLSLEKVGCVPSNTKQRKTVKTPF